MSTFQFKQFTIEQDQCAMKIGTDGVLLGAWTPIKHNPFSVLDIGAGTGIIALQLAQRSYAEQIDALEIDPNAYEQCVENFENSLWSDRLFCYHASLQQFIDEMDDEEYDLIVSNPPFYQEDYQTEDTARNNARFTSSMSFELLLKATAQLLSENGVASFVIPRKEEEAFVALASTYKLYPFEILRVRGTEASEEKRSLIAFSFEQKTPKITQLTIEKSRHDYTQAYIDLVKDFYLKM